MLLLHPHYILLHPLYTCPALFGLMLLHIFLIFLVKTGCTGWYSFLPVLSVIFHTVLVIFQHDIKFIIRQSVKLLVCLVPYIFSFTDISDISYDYTAYPFFFTVFCKPSGHLMKVILYCVLFFPINPFDVFR